MDTQNQNIEEQENEDFEVNEELEIENKGEEVEGEEIESDEVIITIGDEPIEADDEQSKQAPEWVKELRKQHRDLQRRNRELEAKLNTAPIAPKKLRDKPKLEDFDYDADEFEAALLSWQDEKREIEKAEKEQQANLEKEQEAWQAKLTNYQKQKTELKIPDYDDLEETVISTLDANQQNIIVAGADNPALIIAALGRNQSKAKELAAIKDYAKFTFAVAKLEAQLKVSSRKAPPSPEKRVTGNASISGSVDSTLDRLRADAEKTGDYSKVMEYKRNKKK